MRQWRRGKNGCFVVGSTSIDAHRPLLPLRGVRCTHHFVCLDPVVVIANGARGVARSPRVRDATRHQPRGGTFAYTRLPLMSNARWRSVGQVTRVRQNVDHESWARAWIDWWLRRERRAALSPASLHKRRLPLEWVRNTNRNGRPCAERRWSMHLSALERHVHTVHRLSAAVWRQGCHLIGCAVTSLVLAPRALHLFVSSLPQSCGRHGALVRKDVANAGSGAKAISASARAGHRVISSPQTEPRSSACGFLTTIASADLS